MSKTRMEWSWWPREVGLGASVVAGELRIDMGPVLADDGLIEWRATAWRGDDRDSVVAVLAGLDHTECQDEVAAFLLEYRRREAFHG